MLTFNRYLTGEVIEGFRVVPTSPASMSVKVEFGAAAIPKGSSPSHYRMPVSHDTAAGETIALSPAGSLPRIDLIVAYEDTGAPVNTTDANNPDRLVFAAVTGTENASPVEPNTAAIQSAIGAANPYIVLGKIDVAAGAVNIAAAAITDRRAFAVAAYGRTYGRASYVDAGGVWSAVSGLSGAMTALSAFIAKDGVFIPVTVAAIGSRGFTASKDTYVSADYVGVITYTEVANGAGAPALPAHSVWLYKVVTNGSAITSVTDLRPTHLVGTANIADSAITTAKIADGAITAAKISGSTDWLPLGYTPNSITYIGNRSYTMVFNSVDLTSQVGVHQRLRVSRTVLAPTRCTSLDGATQYYSKSSPAGMTFTDDFAVSVWVKLSSYANSVIISRYNGTNGWRLTTDSSGRVYLIGYNGGAGNNSYVSSYQSLPLNKWVHIAAQLDMSAFTTTSTTSYVMIDGVDVPATVVRAGTNPTALVQAGNLEIGSGNATEFFPGKIAQAAVFSAKVTQSTMRGYSSQGLLGTETSLISAYSFDNTLNDLNTTNANNLTANGGATANNGDYPFAQNEMGTPTASTDTALIMRKTFSTNTTLTVQVPEGCTLPTSGGVSAVSYSSAAAPLGFSRSKKRWQIEQLLLAQQDMAGATAGTWYNLAARLRLMVGEWTLGYSMPVGGARSANAYAVIGTLSNASNSESDKRFTTVHYVQAVGATQVLPMTTLARSMPVDVTAVTDYYFNLTSDSTGSSLSIFAGYATGSDASGLIVAEPAGV